MNDMFLTASGVEKVSLYSEAIEQCITMLLFMFKAEKEKQIDKHILKQNTKKNLGDLLNASDRKKIGDNLNGYDISPDMVKIYVLT